MLKLEENDFDLNFLLKFTFDFQMLKDILLKLAKSNTELESKVKNLESFNEEKDKRISNLENKLNIVYIPEEPKYNNENIEKANENIELLSPNTISSETTRNILKIIKENNDKLNNLGKNLNKKISDTFNVLERKIKDLENQNSKEHNTINSKILDFNNNLNDINDKMDGIIIKNAAFDNFSIIKDSGNGTMDAAKVMVQMLEKKINKKIEIIENNRKEMMGGNKYNLKQKIDELKILIDQLNKDIKLLKQNKNNNHYNSIDNKYYNHIKDNNDIDNNIDNKDIDNNNIDNNIDNNNIDNNIDNKDIENNNIENNINNKNIDNNIDNNNINNKDIDNNNIDNNIIDNNDINNNIGNYNINDNNNNYNNTNNINENDFNNSIKELKELIDKKYNDLLLIIEDISKKLKEGEFTGDKMNDILNNIKTEKDKKEKDYSKIDIKNFNKLEEKQNYKTNEKILDIKKKDLNNKNNDKNNNFKSVLNIEEQDIFEITRKIEEINNNLEKKISKNDLKKLYYKTQENSNLLKYIQDKISELNDEIQKLKDNNPSFIKRLESLTHEILELKGNDVKKDVISKPLDILKYIDENKLKEVLKPYKKNIEILMYDKDSLFQQIKEIQNNIKYLDTKERVNMLEEEINEKINDLINKINKKSDKIEINKSLKNFEIQMKALTDNQRIKESDNWILAKQPLGCFNCATCEAKIKNLSPSNDYLPWNKYPQVDRKYHIGQGFSKLLQRINNDNSLKNFNNEKKESLSDFDISNNLYKSMSNIKEKNIFTFKINNRENFKEDFNENILKLNKRYKFPKVFHNKRKKNIILEDVPLTDEENNNDNKSFEYSRSPKIMKITKKKINDFGRQIINSQQKSLIIDYNNIVNSTSAKLNSKLERIKSMPIYENA